MRCFSMARCTAAGNSLIPGPNVKRADTLNPHRHHASGVRAFDSRKNHREAVDIIQTSGFRRNSFRDLPQELSHYAEVSASFCGVRLFHHVKRLLFIKKAFGNFDIFATNVVEAIPNNCSFCSSNSPDTVPGGPKPLGTPASTKRKSNSAVHLENSVSRSAMLPPRAFRVPLVAIN